MPDPVAVRAAYAGGLRGEVLRAAPAEWFVQEERTMLVGMVDASLWQPWRDEAALLLDPAEAARVQRRRIPADRALLTIAYALHRLLLGRVLACEPRHVPLYRDKRGCPRLVDDLVHTSLSHADGLIAIALSRVGPVGVDIERTRRVDEMPSLAQRICHRGDVAALGGLDADARKRALLGLWVRKEAVLKAAGVGLAVEMDEFAAPDEGLVQVPPPAAALDGPVRVRMLDVGAGCVAAIAGPPCAATDCRWLQPQRQPIAG